jgi:8-oxo-dGTP diphosphatase
MNKEVLQFGPAFQGEYKNRLGAYAVIFDETDQILTLKVDGEFHLPGGGIDEGEDPEAAVIRESLEEAGCQIADVQYIGQANQYFPENAMNKVATFFKAMLTEIDITKSIEPDHEPIWMTPKEFIDGPAWGYQRWAVEQTLK